MSEISKPISPHAAKAATKLITQCHLMEIFDREAEDIIQDAIDAAIVESRVAEPSDYAHEIE